MDYMGLVNATLRRLNEVELSAATFAAASKVHAHVKDCVNNAVRDIYHAELEWPFLFVSGLEVLVSGQGVYALPTSAVRIDWDNFFLVSSSALGIQGTALRRLEYDEWFQRHRADDERFEPGTTSVPRRAFRTPDLKFGVSPVPGAAYSIKYNYYRAPDELSAATDTTAIPERYHWGIVDGAMFQVYMFRENETSAGLARDRFKATISKMRTDLIPNKDSVRDDRVARSSTGGFGPRFT